MKQPNWKRKQRNEAKRRYYNWAVMLWTGKSDVEITRRMSKENAQTVCAKYNKLLLKQFGKPDTVPFKFYWVEDKRETHDHHDDKVRSTAERSASTY